MTSIRSRSHRSPAATGSICWMWTPAPSRSWPGWTSRQGSSGRAILWQDDTLYWTADEDTGHIGWLTAAGETGQTAVRWPDTLPVGQGWYVTAGAPGGRPPAGDRHGPGHDHCPPLRRGPADRRGAGADAALCGKRPPSSRCAFWPKAGIWCWSALKARSATAWPGGDTEVQNRCGLISLEDFFAGRPNYREITLHYARDFS